MLKYACSNGHLNVAKCIQYFTPSLRIFRINPETFRKVCHNGHLDVAQWLHQLEPNLSLVINRHDLSKMCRDGHIDCIKWLLQVCQDNIHYSTYDKLFYEACGCGNLVFAQWLLQLKPDVSMYVDSYHSTLVNTCYRGHIEIAKWLLKVKLDDIYQDIDMAFSTACEGGHLNVAQWLLEVKPTINISIEQDYTFRVLYDKGHRELLIWLQNLRPYLYTIEYNEDGSIKYADINSKREARIQQRLLPLWLASDITPDKNNLLYKIPQDVSRYIIETML